MLNQVSAADHSHLLYPTPGSYFQFKAKAIGAGSEGAQATLQDKYRDDMSLAEAENLAFEILKQVGWHVLYYA
jgi:20S proteasome subunit alpha 5